MENGKKQLDQYACVLETAYDVGLRSPGYCHDLFISMEAVTPGQFKSGGAGVKPGYGSHELPFGRTSIALSNNGPTDLVFVDEKHESKALNVLEEKQSAAEIAKASEATGKIAKRVFGGIAGSAGAGSIKLCLRGQFSDKGLAGASENP